VQTAAYWWCSTALVHGKRVVTRDRMMECDHLGRRIIGRGNLCGECWTFGDFARKKFHFFFFSIFFRLRCSSCSSSLSPPGRPFLASACRSSPTLSQVPFLSPAFLARPLHRFFSGRGVINMASSSVVTMTETAATAKKGRTAARPVVVAPSILDCDKAKWGEVS